jgi:hypothetical protein
MLLRKSSADRSRPLKNMPPGHKTATVLSKLKDTSNNSQVYYVNPRSEQQVAPSMHSNPWAPPHSDRNRLVMKFCAPPHSLNPAVSKLACQLLGWSRPTQLRDIPPMLAPLPPFGAAPFRDSAGYF